MNERIRELSEQAANEYLSEMESATDTLSTAKRNELAQKAKQAGIGIIPHGFSEKFAELLIQDFVWQVAKDDQVPQDNQVLIGNRVREHFGVEQ